MTPSAIKIGEEFVAPHVLEVDRMMTVLVISCFGKTGSTNFVHVKSTRLVQGFNLHQYS